MEQTDRNGFRFSTGRIVYAHAGILGLMDVEGETVVTYGYDSECDDALCWTLAERAEVADYMIALWQRFKVSQLYKGHSRTIDRAEY